MSTCNTCAPTVLKSEKVLMLTKFYNSETANVKIVKIQRELTYINLYIAQKFHEI